MGVCYSSIGAKREHDTGRNLHLKSKKSSSRVFSKLSVDGRGGAAAASVDVVVERELSQIPGRLFANGASHIASLYTQQGQKGTNQDAMIVWENFCARSDINATFCGVFDGHGPYGHMVSRKVRDALPLLLRAEWEAKLSSYQNSVQENVDAEGMNHFDNSVDDDGGDSMEVEVKDKFPEMHMPLKKSILKAFKLMDKELKLHATINCFCSGTTAVTLIMQGQDLIIGNVGDSRAVLATRDNGNALTAVQLTVDLKPNLPREAARIQKFKGRVFALQDEPQVTRVWLPNSNSPGLAMARAFGDFCLKDFGLISIPDVYYHRITERDEFVILATDGVWDVLSNKEAVDIVASAPVCGIATRALVDCATRAWRLKYPASKNDDCAAVCLFLKHVSAIDVSEAQSDVTEAHEEELKKIPVPTKGDMEISNEAVADVVVHSGAPKGLNAIVPATDVAKAQNDVTNTHKEETKKVPVSGEEDMGISDEVWAAAIVRSVATKESSEIVPVVEKVEEKLVDRSLGQFKRSLAECLSTDDEWSALEGIARIMPSFSRRAGLKTQILDKLYEAYDSIHLEAQKFRNFGNFVKLGKEAECIK
ncbi:putative protein phosphatase 2C 6 [Abeliophyllum distichum]|uniref:PPM-type phosphatase domain-containing protein n=1 Tax=Abeliophyllum distichum TaxID=126358 RepID=A0ABD1QLX3_9LAMI